MDKVSGAGPALALRAKPFGLDASRVGSGEWQPIETAPKEHAKEILVAAPLGRRMAVVYWLGKERVMYADEDGFVSGWYMSDGHNDPIWYRGWTMATHWMPLPDPPQAKGE